MKRKIQGWYLVQITTITCGRRVRIMFHCFYTPLSGVSLLTCFVPDENSIFSPNDDINFDDAPPQVFEHFQLFQNISSIFSFVCIHLYIIIPLVVLKFFRNK
jgi:hypothetical protein